MTFPQHNSLNSTTCHLSNLRSTNLIWSFSPLSRSLSPLFFSCGFVQTTTAQHNSVKRKHYSPILLTRITACYISSVTLGSSSILLKNEHTWLGSSWTEACSLRMVIIWLKRAQKECLDFASAEEWERETTSVPDGLRHQLSKCYRDCPQLTREEGKTYKAMSKAGKQSITPDGVEK